MNFRFKPLFILTMNQPKFECGNQLFLLEEDRQLNSIKFIPVFITDVNAFYSPEGVSISYTVEPKKNDYGELFRKVDENSLYTKEEVFRKMIEWIEENLIIIDDFLTPTKPSI